MLRYLLRRIALMIPTVFAVSLVSFLVIQLPPGDYLTTVMLNMQKEGQIVQPEQLIALRQRYALDQPLIVQYGAWIGNIVLHGDFGQSFSYARPVSDLLVERLPLTLGLGFTSFLIGWVVALAAGIYSAARKYGVIDYLITVAAFFGVAVPGFLVALVGMYIQFQFFGLSVGGMFSSEYAEANWNLGKVVDLLGHLWLPAFVLVMGGVGGTIRVLRANLLDELGKPYVVAARGRGLDERSLLLRYPVRVALNPFIATIGWAIPAIFDGEVLVSTVFGLETTGPLLLRALQSQDMYLAGSVLFIVCVLTVIGTLISDILLAVVDPRVRAGMA